MNNTRKQQRKKNITKDSQKERKNKTKKGRKKE